MSRMGTYDASEHRAWKSFLRDNSFVASERRMNCVASFLLQNDFYTVHDMKGARHPSAWDGAENLLECKFHLLSCALLPPLWTWQAS